MSSLKTLLGDDLMAKDGKTVDTDEALEGKDTICLYFSAHWCPPCRGFTPMLAEAYKKKTKDGIEIVFVSSDRSSEEFTDYFKEMPWLALPWNSLTTYKKNLADKYDVKGIPKLVVIKRDGEVINMDGRQLVATSKELNF